MISVSALCKSAYMQCALTHWQYCTFGVLVCTHYVHVYMHIIPHGMV